MGNREQANTHHEGGLRCHTNVMIVGVNFCNTEANVTTMPNICCGTPTTTEMQTKGVAEWT